MNRYASPFYSRVLGEFTRKIQEKGHNILLMNIHNEQGVDDILSTALQYQVDGLVITSATLSSTVVESCLQTQTPVVLFNRYSMHNEVSAVYCDGSDGGRKAAELLLPRHRRFACIKGEEGSSTSRDRSQGFIQAIEENGIRDYLCERGDFTYDSGYAAAERLLDRKDRPDAIFCVSDLMALGTMDAARHKFNLKIPEDLSVIGFDDIDMASWSSYDLTTLRQPLITMVDAAISQLFRSIENLDEGTLVRKLKTDLITRTSTRHSP